MTRKRIEFEEWQAETTYPYLENRGETRWTGVQPTRERAVAAGRDMHEGWGWIVSLRHRKVVRLEEDWIAEPYVKPTKEDR